MIDPMKSVAADVVLEPLIRPRIHRRGLRHLAMKSRVEDRNLEDSAQELFNDFHAFEFGTIFLHNSTRIFDLGFRYPVAPLDLAFPNWSRRIVGKSLVHLIQRALLAAGTRIEYENLH